MSNDPILDIPDGLTAHEVQDEGRPALSFYTGRWTIIYSREEVQVLRDALTEWLERTAE